MMQKHYYLRVENLVLPYMNLIATNSPDKLSLHVIVERLDSGHFTASVPELIDCVVSAETREAVIAAIKEKVTARLKNIEVLTLEVTSNP